MLCNAQQRKTINNEKQKAVKSKLNETIKLSWEKKEGQDKRRKFETGQSQTPNGL